MKDEEIFKVNGYLLDKEQRKVVLNNNRYTLVVAGAGSGKSLTMIGKIRYLIEIKNIKPSDILCITFTRDAACNLEKNINENYKYNINVYTFHKLALKILKKNKYNIAKSDLLNYIVSEYFYITDKKYIVKKILGMFDYPYSYILNSKELLNLKKNIITYINLFKTSNYKLNDFLKMKSNNFMILVIEIYILYLEELKSTNSIDFNDMIILAIKNIDEISLSYKYVIVDEYQDTSYIRYLLLKKIVDKTCANLICVGDDYQSIYGFNGCDINMFFNFKKMFKKGKILYINTTYRNSQQLLNVASKFILKNKKQIPKKLKSNKINKTPIKIMYGNNLARLLDKVLLIHKDILVLGRNNFDINKYFKIDSNGYFEYKNNKIKYMTVHTSKGLEAECVIIINLTNDILGFPCKKKDSKYLYQLKKYKCNYLYEEERRLFYVAITRSKSDVYFLIDRNNVSIFVKEIIKDSSKYIEYI